MTRPVSVRGTDEIEIRTSRAFPALVAPAPQQRLRLASEPLTQERVVAEIVRAVRGMRMSFAQREITGDTNLGPDLGFDLASRQELLLEVQRALDVVLEAGIAVMFAEITIAQLADLIVTLRDSSMGP
jgi:hypothetical protein